MRWRWQVRRLSPSASQLEDNNEGLRMEKDRLHCISGKSEPLLDKLCGSALMPLSEIGSATVRRNVDNSTR